MTESPSNIERTNSNLRKAMSLSSKRRSDIDPQPALSKVFTNKERHQIDRLTARAEFRRLRPFIKGA